jgi:hypothetical protein
MTLNPWLTIPPEDYEGHMCSSGVQQLTALAQLFKRALDNCVPESAAVLGIAGGNGLEQIDRAVTKRIVGVGINQRYLDEVQPAGPARRPGTILLRSLASTPKHCSGRTGTCGIDL